MSAIRQQFEDQGYYFAPAVFAADEIAALTTEFDKVVAQLNASDEDANGRWTSEALDAVEGERKTTITHSHMIHRYSAKWAQAMYHEGFLGVAREILGDDIVLHHNKLFHKPPKRGSGFPVHQDWSYFPTEQDSMIAAIIHLTDATDEMGCVRVFPESHKLGKLPDSDGTVPNDLIANDYKLEDGVPMQAKAGDVLFFHYTTLHGSKPNVSDRDRKTVLFQMHAGADRVIPNAHPYDQTVLSGMNPHMTRAAGNSAMGR